MRSLVRTPAVSVGSFTIALFVGITRADDCNENAIPDECDVSCGTKGGPCDVAGCGASLDCNLNSRLDECELAMSSDLPAFASGFDDFLLDIAQAQGDYPPGYYVAGAYVGIHHVSPDAVVTILPSTDEVGYGVTFAAADFFQGEPALFASGTVFGDAAPRVWRIPPSAPPVLFAELPDGIIYDLTYIPLNGGGAANKLVTCSCVQGFDISGVQGRLHLIDAEGVVSTLVELPFCPFGLELAPNQFGAASGQLLVSDACALRIIAFDLVSLESYVFTQIAAERDACADGFRHMTFSPVGWAGSLSPDLADQSVLLIVRSLDYTNATLDMFASNGHRISRLFNFMYHIHTTINPQGMTFSARGDLLIVGNMDAVLRASANDFVPGDCNENDVPDDCDLAGGSVDCNENGVPEECESVVDCNSNSLRDSCEVVNGTAFDSDEDGLLNECEFGIVASNPLNGAIDARQPSELDGSLDSYGWRIIDLIFDAVADNITQLDFGVTQVGGASPPPTIETFLPIPNGRRIVLSRAIEVGAWTVITHIGSQTSIRIGYLPGDVNGNRVSNWMDVLVLIDALNNQGEPRPIHQTDINRSGAANPSDILRLIDLLNGAGEFPIFDGAALPA